MKIAVVSLGCPKNQADADVFCRALIEDGHNTVPQVEQAEAVIINTCGFIQSAKEEAIEAILNACSAKKENPDLKVVVTGCLAERYREELSDEIPEVDAVVGIGANGTLPQIMRELSGTQQPALHFARKTDLPLGGSRIISTPGHYAWLKIAEGCSHNCSYCAIPAIRGPLRSRPFEDCVQEAKWLAEQGVREVVLVAQDVTAYGDDLGRNRLCELLRALDEIEGLHWIRLLYAYPERITEELLQTIAASRHVLPYLDLPIQHIDDGILRSMRRVGDSATIRGALRMIRRILPKAVLRTTLIAGYPGETEEQYQTLCNFVEEAKFDRLGCFAYSPEEGTSAAKMDNQLEEEEKQRRANDIMEIQSRIMAQKQEAYIGKTIEVVCDGMDEDEAYWLCRSAADAPEIDANVLVDASYPMQEGQFYNVYVTAADEVDLYASME
ncbi:MAG: 30S ribosomal protein S12 methylthiotransferase RimO [Oscillospiraceae bacterium]